MFSAEQERLYQTRYKVGYDLPDSDYHDWLTIHHPEFVSANQHVCVPPSNQDECPESLADLFSFVEPQSPLTITDSSVRTEPTPLDGSLGSTPTCLDSDSAVEPTHKPHSFEI